MTAQVRAELGGDLAVHGEIGKGRTVRGRDTNSKKQDDATYILARLRRGQKGRFGPIPSPFLSPVIYTGIGRNCPNRPNFALGLGFRGAVLGALLKPYPTRGAVS